MLKRQSNFKETAGLVSSFKKLAQYGYYNIKYAGELTEADLQTALKALGVKSSDKVVCN